MVTSPAPDVWIHNVTSLGTWKIPGAAGPAGDFTVPTTLSASTVSGVGGFVDLTLTPVGAPPGVVTLTTADAQVTFSQASVNLNTTPAQTVRVNLPARTASYGFTVSARAGSNPAKTVGVNVSVAQPSITLTLGAQTPSPAFATAGATLRVNVGSTAWTGSVLVTCSSGAAGVSCPGRYVNVAAGASTPVDLAVDTTTATPNGAALSVTATPQGAGAPGARTVNGTLSMATGLTLRAPSPLPVLFTGSPMSFSLLVVPSGGYTGAVNVACSGIAGVVCAGAGSVVDRNPVAVPVTVSGATGAVVGSRALTITAGAWQLTQPANGSTLSSTTFFVWPMLPLQWRLRVGRLGPGSEDLRPGVATTGGTGTVRLDGVPTNRLVYATLETLVDGAWLAKNYVYNGSVVGGGGGGGGGGGTGSVLPSWNTSSTTPIASPGGSVTYSIALPSQGGFSGGVSIECAAQADVTCARAHGSVVPSTVAQVPVLATLVPSSAGGYRTIDLTIKSLDDGRVLGMIAVPLAVGISKHLPADESFSVVIGEGEQVYDFVTVPTPGSSPNSVFTWTCGAGDGVSCRVFDINAAGFKVGLTAYEGAAAGTTSFSITACATRCFPTGSYALNVKDAPPVILSVYPSQVQAGSGGIPLRITGRNFGVNNSLNLPQRLVVAIPGSALVITSWQSNTITADLDVPEGAPPGSYIVTVNSAGSTGTSNFLAAAQANAQAQIQVDPAPPTGGPVISGISPTQVAPGRTGVTLTIRGRGFGASPSVSIENAANVSLVAANDGSIEVRFDSTGMAVGDNPVRVTAGGQTSSPASLKTACAKPTNFRQVTGASIAPGVLRFTYNWDSTTGDKSDLNSCLIREVVRYPRDGSRLQGGTLYCYPSSPPYWSTLRFRSPTFLPNPPIANGNADWDVPDTHSARSTRSL